MTRTMRSRKPHNLCVPIYAVGCLHIGDGGPTDNFLACNEDSFEAWLDFVEDGHGSLVIVGDLFELWQSLLSSVLVRGTNLLDRLYSMDAIYVLGNHDADLKDFCNSQWFRHPFFDNMCLNYQVTLDKKDILFTHGHEADDTCCDVRPGLARISAIVTAMEERRNGSPIFGRTTVENLTLGPWIRAWKKVQHLLSISQDLPSFGQLLRACHPNVDTVVHAHTHVPGTIYGEQGQPWGLNAGTWAEPKSPSFVKIEADGAGSVWDWVDQSPVQNMGVLV